MEKPTKNLDPGLRPIHIHKLPIQFRYINASKYNLSEISILYLFVSVSLFLISAKAQKTDDAEKNAPWIDATSFENAYLNFSKPQILELDILTKDGPLRTYKITIQNATVSCDISREIRENRTTITVGGKPRWIVKKSVGPRDLTSQEIEMAINKKEPPYRTLPTLEAKESAIKSNAVKTTGAKMLNVNEPLVLDLEENRPKVKKASENSVPAAKAKIICRSKEFIDNIDYDKKAVQTVLKYHELLADKGIRIVDHIGSSIVLRDTAAYLKRAKIHIDFSTDDTGSDKGLYQPQPAAK